MGWVVKLVWDLDLRETESVVANMMNKMVLGKLTIMIQV